MPIVLLIWALIKAIGVLKAYISLSYSKRKSLLAEMSQVCDVLETQGIEPLIFVDKYHFNVTQEKQMMEQAFADIESCDIFIAEVSEKAIGVGVETGFARAKGKIIIYMRHHHAQHSSTVSGSGDYQIIYKDCNDLGIKLLQTLNKIMQKP